MKEHVISRDRRYYYDFVCEKCKKRNKGYEMSSVKGGLATKEFLYHCNLCDKINVIDFDLKYMKTVQIEITEEEFYAS